MLFYDNGLVFYWKISANAVDFLSLSLVKIESVIVPLCTGTISFDKLHKPSFYRQGLYADIFIVAS